jgi:hypothetical protein
MKLEIIIGAGTIGASLATLFFANDLEAILTNIAAHINLPLDECIFLACRSLADLRLAAAAASPTFQFKDCLDALGRDAISVGVAAWMRSLWTGVPCFISIYASNGRSAAYADPRAAL